MSERFDNLLNALKGEKVISLYYNRVMFYDEGMGEIQFWNLSEKDDMLVLSNAGCQLFFDDWSMILNDNGKATGINLKMGDKFFAAMKFPNPTRLIQNHNHFYIDEFAVEMSSALDGAVAQKGDWTFCTFDTVEKGLKHNLGKLKNSTEENEFKESCVDLANYAAMAYYLVNEWRKDVR